MARKNPCLKAELFTQRCRERNRLKAWVIVQNPLYYIIIFGFIQRTGRIDHFAAVSKVIQGILCYFILYIGEIFKLHGVFVFYLRLAAYCTKT